MENNRKAVIFDFDGTITEKRANVWNECWKTTNLTIDLDKRLFNAFVNKKITYYMWNYLVCNIFRSRKFSKDILDQISSNIQIKPGVGSLLQKLKENDFDIFILSGGILQCIKSSLYDYLHYFKYISANEFIFDQDGILKQIKSTPFDFEGKATFVKRLIVEKGYKRENITFVGNSENDEYVHRVGVKTICITPHKARSDNREIWNECIESLEDFSELIPYLITKRQSTDKKIEF